MAGLEWQVLTGALPCSRGISQELKRQSGHALRTLTASSRIGLTPRMSTILVLL
jgi:hypothetical protein